MNPPSSIDIQNGYRECQRICRASGSSFPLAFRLLPAPQRDAITAIYAYCRILDDAVDGNDSVEAKQIRLDDYLAELIGALKGDTKHPVFIAVADAVQRYSLPTEPLYDLILGMRMDIRGYRPADETQLYLYCDRVAGTVGLLVVALLGVPIEVGHDYAIWTGRALQLTNILRDIREDADRNRVYLPQNWLDRYSVTQTMLSQKTFSKNVGDLLAFVGVETEAAYRQAVNTFPSQYRSQLRFSEALRAIYRTLYLRLDKAHYDSAHIASMHSYSKLVAALRGYTSPGFRW